MTGDRLGPRGGVELPPHRPSGSVAKTTSTNITDSGLYPVADVRRSVGCGRTAPRRRGAERQRPARHRPREFQSDRVDPRAHGGPVRSARLRLEIARARSRDRSPRPLSRRGWFRVAEPRRQPRSRRLLRERAAPAGEEGVPRRHRRAHDAFGDQLGRQAGPTHAERKQRDLALAATPASMRLATFAPRGDDDRHTADHMATFVTSFACGPRS